MQSVNLLMIKPVGNCCNLSCSYCYVINESDHAAQLSQMSVGTLEQTIKATVPCRPTPIMLWSGGEPLLASIHFFEKVLTLQKKILSKTHVINSIQTNGTLLNDAWIKVFKEANFQIGISWDGFKSRLRRTERNECTSIDVFEKIKQCRSADLDIGVIMVISQDNLCNIENSLIGLYELGVRNVLLKPYNNKKTDGHSLMPEEYAQLMCRLLDLWLSVGDKDWKVEHLASFVRALRGERPTSCEFANSCHTFLTVQHNGDVTTCDFMGDSTALGNVSDNTIPEICEREAYIRFRDCASSIPSECYDCKWTSFCRGGCLHYRLPINSVDQCWGLHSLCEAQKQIFDYYSRRLSV